MAGIFSYDDALRDEGFPLIAGIDEAGRGPLAGPVVASAVILIKKERIRGLRDSKKLSARQIEAIFREILYRALSIGVGIVDSSEIDRINILNATKKAMEIAVHDLSLRPHLVLIDALTITGCSIPQRSFVKGEDVSASIAAASVVAKYVRDCVMRLYHDIYPAYGFDRHKGYATGKHMQCIREFGPCPIHRTSFSPVTTLNLFARDE